MIDKTVASGLVDLVVTDIVLGLAFDELAHLTGVPLRRAAAAPAH